ncbi:kinase-like protein [Auriscalpium vulgare]|uniref:Kinase-like protein n=1 Tax=Auriscalpium vulgare TaxID=40419 RepID=A0ACB8RDD2_9AGAM|nr:kinase-like protein [Auriscalpium vulgare]
MSDLLSSTRPPTRTPSSQPRSVASLLASRGSGSTPIPPSLQAKMAAMATRASQSPSMHASVDVTSAAFKRATLNDTAPRQTPSSSRAPAMPGRRNKPGFKLSDITGEPSSGGAANAGLGAGAPSLEDGPSQWQPRRPSPTGTPFSNFGKIVDPSGALNFGGKAILHSSGVDFSNGSSFAINMNQLQLEDELGRGAYGTVKRVLHKPTNVLMAMKEIRLELDQTKLNAIIMELDILHRAVHPSIVEFYGAFFIESCVYYCMEYMDAGSLDKLYGVGVPEPVLSRIVACMARGLKFLKDELQIIHRDVKPTNVLVNKRGEIKLCDFGVSGQLEKSLAKTNIGCQSYMAPERIKGESQNALSTYTVSSDVWSLGLATLEIAVGQYPYPPETYQNVFAQLTAIVHGDPPELPDSYSHTAKDWVNRCLVKRPEGRASYAQLLEHPFLRGDQTRPTDMRGWVVRALSWREEQRQLQEHSGDAPRPS